MSKTVILLGHKARSGKDTFATMLADITGGEVMSFAEPLKQIIADTFFMEVSELERCKNEGADVLHSDGGTQGYRAVLQRFGTEAMKKQFGDNVWGELMLKRIQESEAEVILVPDFRFPKEDAYLRWHLDAADRLVTVNINRLGLIIDPTPHVSETELDGFIYDYTVMNSGSLEDLKLKAYDLEELIC